MKITDKMRLDFMGRKGTSWNFTNQMIGGLYCWDSPPPHDFHRSIRAAIDAAIRASRRGKKK